MTLWAIISIETALMPWVGNTIKKDTILNQHKKILEATVMMILKITI